MVQATTARITASRGNIKNLIVKRTILYVFFLPWYLTAQDFEDLKFNVRGLTAEVEILVDRWGVSHI